MKTRHHIISNTALLALGISFIGCTQSRILVYDTQSDSVPQIEQQWVSDNDTLMIAYSFWGEGGKLSCVIFNKTDRQLFIDWKNSAFILNNRKIDFWSDAVQFSSTTNSTSRSYQASLTSSANPFNWEWLTQSIGTQHSSSTISGTMVSNERITSIPSKSYIGLERFTYLSDPLYLNAYQTETTLEPSYTNSNRQQEVIKAEFNSSSSPLRLRVFLTYDHSEDMRAPQSLNDTFWLSSISDMSFRHFKGKVLSRDQGGIIAYEKPRKNRRSFYSLYTK